MEEKTQKEKIVEFFQSLNWPGMIFEDSKITCPSGDIAVFNKKDTTIDFHFYNQTQNSYEKRNNRQTLIISERVEPSNILRARGRTGYDISWFDYMKDILNIDDTFTKIKIMDTGKKILRKGSEKTLQIPESIFSAISDDSYDVYKKGQSSKNRIETFLINKLKLKYTNKSPKEVTTIGKGDFFYGGTF